ncbi:hypothetical protein D3C73_1173700 [compost metagenome]
MQISPSFTINRLSGLACPTGNGSCAASTASVTSIQVVATVASVGPYVFRMTASGKRWRSFLAKAAGSGSPQNRKVRSAGKVAGEKSRLANCW